MRTSAASIPAPERRFDVDWLRVFATYLLFVFHAAKVFDVAPYYHVKSALRAPVLDFVTGFIHVWHMPLFFVLAGWSVWDSLRRRGVLGFAVERLHKLLLPLVFGMATLGPFLRWAELRTGQFVSALGSPLPAEPGLEFLAYLPRYFSDPAQLTWGHLWFLAYLLTFTLLYLPILASAVQLRIAARLREAHVPRWMVYVPIVPLLIVQLTLRERWPGHAALAPTRGARGGGGLSERVG